MNIVLLLNRNDQKLIYTRNEKLKENTTTSLFREKCWCGPCTISDSSVKLIEPIVQDISGLIVIGRLLGVFGLAAFLE